MSLAERMALLNGKQSSPTSSPTSASAARGVPGSLKDRIAKYDVPGAAPLVPRGSFGQGLGTPSEGRGAVSREMIGNRIPSAGRGGFGITPGSRSTSAASSQAKPGLQGASWSAPRSRTTSTTSSPGNGSRDSSPSTASNQPPPLSEPQTTTNALPSSYLSATDPDAPARPTAASRTNSVLAQPSSTTSLSSLATDASGAPSIASSYLPMSVSVSQQPTPPAEAIVPAVPFVIEPERDEEEEDPLVVGGNGRPSSPVGSMRVEVSDSVAPSLHSTDDSPVPSPPSTPKAEPTTTVLADSTATLEKLSLGPEDEPEIEQAEHVPALDAKEASEFTENVVAKPEVEIETPPANGEEKEKGVGSWREDVAAHNINSSSTKAAAPAELTAKEPAASPAPSLAPPTTGDEEESVYHTPTLEYQSPSTQVPELPADEDADRTLDAPEAGLGVEEEDAGLVTPKSVAVSTLSGAEDKVPTLVAVEPAPSPPMPLGAPVDPSISETSSSAAGSEQLTPEEREKRRRDKKRAKKKAQRKRAKRAANASGASEESRESAMSTGDDVSSGSAESNSDALVKTEHSNPTATSNSPSSPPPREATLPPSASSKIPFPIYHTPPVTTAPQVTHTPPSSAGVQVSRSASGNTVIRNRSPLELDSEDDEAGEGVKVLSIKREQYS